jgi:hypothetical protein
MLASTVLETLRCNIGSSRPYLWTELLIIDDDTIASAALVAATSHGSLDIRTVLADHIGPGGSAAVPESIARLSRRFRTGVTQRTLILVALLFDKRDTPGHAMAAGHNVFLSEVRNEVARNALGLNGPEGPDRDQLVREIKQRLTDKITAAIKEELSGPDKLSIALHLEHSDRLIASAFKAFDNVNVPSAPFSLPLQKAQDGILVGGLPVFDDDYQLDGTLVVTDDTCEQQVIDVGQITHEIANINGRMRQLGRAHGGEPTQEDEQEIDRLRTELQDRQAQLASAQDALATCRAQHGVVTADPPTPPTPPTPPLGVPPVPVPPISVPHPHPDTGGGGGGQRRPPRQEP